MLLFGQYLETDYCEPSFKLFRSHISSANHVEGHDIGLLGSMVTNRLFKLQGRQSETVGRCNMGAHSSTGLYCLRKVFSNWLKSGSECAFKRAHVPLWVTKHYSGNFSLPVTISSRVAGRSDEVSWEWDWPLMLLKLREMERSVRKFKFGPKLHSV